MQGRRSIFDPFSQTVDLNHGSASNITGANEPEDWNSIPSPMERRLLNNDLSSELDFSSMNTSAYHNSRSFSCWDVGESSSRANTQDQVDNDSVNVEQDWSFSFDVHDSVSKERQPESSNIHQRRQLAVQPSNMQSSGSNHGPLNISLNVGYDGNNGVDSGQGMTSTNLYKSGRPETVASDLAPGIGTSSEGGPESSLGSWGLSCKRKALEGTSQQSFADGSSSCFRQAENIVRQTVTVHHNASSNLGTSPPVLNRREQLNPRTGVGMRAVASDAFPPSSVPESSQRHFGMRESIPSNISSNTNPTPCSNNSSSHQSPRPMSFSEYLDQNQISRGPVMTSASSSNPSNQRPPSTHGSIPRTALPFPWADDTSSRNGSSSSSAGERCIQLRTALPLPWPDNTNPRTGSSSSSAGERGSEVNFRTTPRNNMQHHNFVSSNEPRNVVQDPISWSLAASSAPSSSRTGTASGSRPSNTLWTPLQNSGTQNQQRLSGLPPSTGLPSAELESGGGHRSHFTRLPSGSSSTSEDNLIPPGINRHGRHRPPSYWRALSAHFEGRQRLLSEVRQVVNAIQRGERLRPEHYVVLDPFLNDPFPNGVAEFHDRHRDMRLDVDNMSYEELLALGERIGNVNTGLSEDVILKSLKQRKHIAFMAILNPNLEPCCICREEYMTGDDIGSLDCGHEFHTDCIKLWLVQKNLCPICKKTGLAT